MKYISLGIKSQLSCVKSVTPVCTVSARVDALLPSCAAQLVLSPRGYGSRSCNSKPSVQRAWAWMKCCQERTNHRSWINSIDICISPQISWKPNKKKHFTDRYLPDTPLITYFYFNVSFMLQSSALRKLKFSIGFSTLCLKKKTVGSS